MADHIYVQLSNDGESVVIGARNETVIFKHQEKMSHTKARRIASQLLSKMPEAEMHEIAEPEGQRSSTKRRNNREWDQTWKTLDPDKETHLQITIDGELIEDEEPIPPPHPSAITSDIAPKI